MNFNSEWDKKRLTKPRMVTIAGIISSLLFATGIHLGKYYLA
jgi:hypothetical protein